jgi:competence protein ComEC
MPNEIIPVFAIGLVFSLAAIYSATWQQSARWSWAFLFIGGVYSLSAARQLQLEGSRKTTSRLLDLPPRELNLEIHIERVFDQKTNSVKFSGLAQVEGTSDVRQDLSGKQIYFRLGCKNQDGGLIEGDRIRALGVLYRIQDSDDSSFTRLLLAKGIQYEFRRGEILEKVVPASAFAHFCRNSNRDIEKLLRFGAEPEDELVAGITVAMLLGKKTAIPRDQKEHFILAGVMHLFAISGLHIAILAGLIKLLLRRVPGPRWIEASLMLTLLYVYVQITGGAPSAQRAFIMIAFWKASDISGRRGGAFQALVTSAVFVLAIDPWQFWDKGFQLSYAVVFSIILYGVPLGKRMQVALRPWRFLSNEELSGHRKSGVVLCHWFFGAFAISIAATLASSPLSADAFGVFSPGGVLLNVFLVFLAVGAIWLAVFSVPLAACGFDFLHETNWCIIRLMDFLVDVFIRIPGFFYHAEVENNWAPAIASFSYLGVCLALADRLPSSSALVFFAAPACIAFFIAFGTNLSF